MVLHTTVVVPFEIFQRQHCWCGGYSLICNKRNLRFHPNPSFNQVSRTHHASLWEIKHVTKVNTSISKRNDNMQAIQGHHPLDAINARKMTT